MLDYYRKVADENHQILSVAQTAKTTNKSTTTIQKLRAILIENGDIIIKGQNGYLNTNNINKEA